MASRCGQVRVVVVSKEEYSTVANRGMRNCSRMTGLGDNLRVHIVSGFSQPIPHEQPRQ